jgi:hypothetical protein
MGLFSISCKKATYLSSKKEEGKLSWMEKIQLRSHMTICSLCRLFEQQSQIIAHHAKHAECKDKLSEEAKRRIQTNLDSV